MFKSDFNKINLLTNDLLKVIISIIKIIQAGFGFHILLIICCMLHVILDIMLVLN